MKKTLAVMIAFSVLTLILCGCGGKVGSVSVIEIESEIYSQDDIYDAIAVVKDYFKANFDGCTLLEICYIGDEKSDSFSEVAEQNGADEAIVLISSFYVSTSCDDDSLEQDRTYKNWQWVLVRSGGDWLYVTHGYG